jgi:hypothetical protein
MNQPGGDVVIYLDQNEAWLENIGYCTITEWYGDDGWPCDPEDAAWCLATNSDRWFTLVIDKREKSSVH